MDFETARPGVDVLSQPEVERVLAEVAREESHATILRRDGTRERRPRESVVPHDFRTPAFLAPGLWRRLRLEHQDFTAALAGRFTTYLRLDTAVRLGALEAVPYREFTRTLAEPTHLALFKLEPLRGIGLLDIHPQLGLCIVDRLLGGPGHGAGLSRELSDIEIALLDQALGVLLEQWCLRWAGLQDLRPAILGHETSGRYLQTAAADAMMLVVVLAIQLGNCLEEIKFAFPCMALEPLLRQLKPALEPAKEPGASAAAPAWKPALSSLKVPLTARWPDQRLAARAVAGLKVGELLEWDPSAAGQVSLRVGPHSKFTGRLGTRAGRWAIEITRLQPRPNS